MKEKPNDGSPFFGVFPSDYIHKATEGVNAHFFINCFTSCNNSCKFYQKIPGTFEATCVIS